MNGRRACLYSAAAHLGGAERSLLELARGLAAAPDGAWSPSVLLPVPGGPFADALRREGLPHAVLPLPAAVLRLGRQGLGAKAGGAILAGPSLAAYVLRLRRLLRGERAAVLHSNGLKCHLLAALAGRAAGVPVLWHLREVYGPGPVRGTLRLARRILQPQVLANSRATAEAFAPGDSRVAVVHNGLDPALVRAAPHGRLKERLGVPPGVPLVGIVGALCRLKGQHVFLEAAALLLRGGVTARFAVVGGEIYDTGSGRGWRAFLEAEARRLGIAAEVTFTGELPDPAGTMNGLDLLVQASVVPESFGRTVLEALACGVPVVGPAIGGVPEILRDGRDGLLCPPGDAQALAAAMRRVLTEPGLAARLREGGPRRFRDAFTLDRHVAGVRAVYDGMWAGR